MILVIIRDLKKKSNSWLTFSYMTGTYERL